MNRANKQGSDHSGFCDISGFCKSSGFCAVWSFSRGGIATKTGRILLKRVFY